MKFENAHAMNQWRRLALDWW